MLNITKQTQHTAVALGFFDGVHRGHRAVLQEALGNQGLIPCVFTFTTKKKTPDAKTGYTYLTTPTQKDYYLKQLGIQEIFCPDFSQIKGITPQQFVDDLLKGQLMAKVVCCGENFHFGKDRAGGIDQLRTLCAQAGIEVKVAGAVLYGDEPVSSTRVRAAIRNGEIQAANSMLGRPYCFTATVQTGKRLGRTIGFPTINQRLPSEMTIPKAGVYATTVTLGGKGYSAITNIGKQPTVGGQDILAETYILDYSGELYGKDIEISVLEYLRAIRKFDNIQKLSLQLAQDTGRAQEICKSFLQGQK